MQDIIKPVGSTKSSKPDAGGGNIRSVPVFGIVKNNTDPTRSGRLQVYVSDFGSDDPDDSSAWVTVSYMSPFFGYVQPSSSDTGYGSYTANPSSYGFWNSPPDIGSTVICIFINGDPRAGFAIGRVPKPEALHMVPAIGSAENVILNAAEAQGYGGATRLPVTNINVNNSSIADSAGYLKEAKPVHSYSAAILNQQGLIRDPIRGPISSSAQRESPSRVGWGVSTPGRPIYEGGYTDKNILDAADSNATPNNLKVIARRGGHSIVMDDGDIIGQDQLVRIRSAGGHQILMSDDGQTLFIIHSNGQSYIELGKEGTIDMYSTNSVNVRTQGDLNLHADNNINIHANKKFNIKAEEINIQSDKNTNHKVGANYKVDTTGTFTHKVAGPMSMQSSGDSSYASNGSTYINGSKVNLNSGSSSTVPQSVKPIPTIAHTDTLYDSTKGFAAAPNKLESITSRAPAHAPWENACKGVDVKINLSASGSLPASPSTSVAATNAATSIGATTPAVSQASVSTVPSTSSVSSSINKNTASALIGATAQNAALTSNQNLSKAGAAIVQTTTGATALIGVLGQTPKQLEQAGIIKPGSSALVNSLIQSGANLQTAMPTNIFTGVNGAENLQSLVKNVGSQVNSQLTNFEKTQTALTNAGVICGKENATEIAGLIMSGSTVGVKNTLNAVQQLNKITKLPAAGIPGVTNEVNKMLNAGSYAAKLAQQTLGGNNSLSGALSLVNKVQGLFKKGSSKGSSSEAFYAILEQFKPLTPNVPQNLRTIAQQRIANREEADSTQQVTQILNTTSRIIGGKGGAILRETSGLIGTVKNLSNIKTAAGAINATASIIKGVDRIQSIINNDVPNVRNRQLSSIPTVPQRQSYYLPNETPTPQRQSSPTTISTSIYGAINSIEALRRAKTTTAAISAATSLYKNIDRVASVLGSSTYASGVTNLPGGQNSVSAIVNSSIRSTKVPGTEAVSLLINNFATGNVNNISVQKSLMAELGTSSGNVSTLASTITQGIGDAFNKLKSGDTTLSSLVSSNLPIDVSSQLTSLVGSVSSVVSDSINVPTVGISTVDRSEIIAQTTSLLGDSRIPQPNFSGEISATQKSKLGAIESRFEYRKQLQKEYNEIVEKRELAKKRWYELRETLPQGDPSIEQAKREFDDLAQQATRKTLEIINK